MKFENVAFNLDRDLPAVVTLSEQTKTGERVTTTHEVPDLIGRLIRFMYQNMNSMYFENNKCAEELERVKYELQELKRQTIDNKLKL